MNDATHGADNIRNDISALAQRYAVIERDEECGVMAFPDLLGLDYPYFMYKLHFMFVSYFPCPWCLIA